MAIRKYNTYSSAEIDIFHQIVTKLGEEIKKVNDPSFLSDHKNLLINYSPDKKKMLRIIKDDDILSIGARAGDVELVEYYLSELIANPDLDIDLVNRINNQGYSMLNLACLGGHFALVKYLCEEAGANISKPARDGRNNKTLAFFAQHTDIVDYFNRFERESPASVVRRGGEDFTAVKKSSRCVIS